MKENVCQAIFLTCIPYKGVLYFWCGSDFGHEDDDDGEKCHDICSSTLVVRSTCVSKGSS